MWTVMFVLLALAFVSIGMDHARRGEHFSMVVGACVAAWVTTLVTHSVYYHFV